MYNEVQKVEADFECTPDVELEGSFEIQVVNAL
jgi:hypothetical protein